MQAILFWFGVVISALLVWVVVLLLRQFRHHKWHHREGDRGLSRRLETALGYLRKRGDITAKEYENFAGVSHATAVRDLNKLEKLGLVQQVGSSGRGVYYHVLKKK